MSETANVPTEDLHLTCGSDGIPHRFAGVPGGLCAFDLWPNASRPHRCGRLEGHDVHAAKDGS